ncbi:hypothetical protein CR513_17501, partial [Mucuna pruriens]
MENKRHVVNTPPLFKVQNYDYWKQRMIAFFDACHIDMWDIVENGQYIPTDKDEAEIPRSSWNDQQKTTYLLNSKARNFLMCAFTEAKYEKVHSYKSSKEIWDTLALAYEDHESIDQMFGRLQTIINNLRSLDKTYNNYDYITKILRSLPREWRPHVTNLRVSKDLKKLPMEELISMLKVHEIELNKDEGQRKGNYGPQSTKD